MAVTDLTADMLTRIRNASRANKKDVEIKRSKLITAICEILVKEGFIGNFKPIEDNKQGLLKIYLKYHRKNCPALIGLRKISKPGLKIYKKHHDLPKVLGGVGIAIVSTSQGLMTASEARSKNLGGEIICYAW